MSALTPILRQIMLLQLLQEKRDGVGLADIARYMAARLDINSDNYIDRTFQRDKKSLADSFGITICYHKLNNVYRIENSPVDISIKALEAFEVMSNLLFKEEVTPYLLFDQRRAKGLEYFNKLLQATKAGVLVRFIYQSFIYPEVDGGKRLVEPYALKEFKGRWYLLAKDSKDNRIKTFGLDRMTALAPTRKKFNHPEDFDPVQRFSNCFGIIGPYDRQVPDELVLSLSELQYKYVKSFPLHHSQRDVESEPGTWVISLYLCINHDIEMEILSYGEEVEVLKPDYFREIIKRRLTGAASQYH